MRIHFACIYNYAHFASKQTSARIDYLRQAGDWRAKRALIMLKFLLKTRQKWLCYVPRVWANGMESTHVYGRQSLRL